jgi:hypothetical protein
MLVDGEKTMSRGKIIRIEDYGLGFVEREGSSDRYPFTFDKIRGYGGQPLSSLGLHVGSKVNFLLDHGTVLEVLLPGPIA